MSRRGSKPTTERPGDCAPCGAKGTVTYRYDSGFVYECSSCGRVERRSSSGGGGETQLKGGRPSKVTTGGSGYR